MTRYSFKLRDRAFVKGHGYKYINMGRNIGKNISKNLSGKYNQKRLNDAKQYETHALKTAFKKSNSENSRSNR